MAKIQFNCWLEREVRDWIRKEARRQSKAAKVSQGDVVTLLVSRAAGSASGGSVPRGLADHIAGAGAYQDLGRKGKGIDLDVLRRARKREAKEGKG